MVKRFCSEKQKSAKTSLKEFSDFYSPLFSVSVSFLSYVMRFLFPRVGFLKMLFKLILICIFQAFVFFFCLWFLLEVCKF